MQRDEKVSESTELEIGQMKIWKSRKPTQQKGVSCTEFQSRLPTGGRGIRSHIQKVRQMPWKRYRQPDLQDKPTVLSSKEPT